MESSKRRFGPIPRAWCAAPAPRPLQLLPGRPSGLTGSASGLVLTVPLTLTRGPSRRDYHNGSKSSACDTSARLRLGRRGARVNLSVRLAYDMRTTCTHVQHIYVRARGTDVASMPGVCVTVHHAAPLPAIFGCRGLRHGAMRYGPTVSEVHGGRPSRLQASPVPAALFAATCYPRPAVPPIPCALHPPCPG